jgi:hypothetical protein
MKRHAFPITRSVALSFALLAGTSSVAASQEQPKPAEEKKTIDVLIKVSTQGGEPVPADSKVEVSGQEQACGELNDPRKTLDANGAATFAKLPACIVSVKAFLRGYIQVGVEMNGKKLTSKVVDLRQYGNSVSIVMEKEH